MKLLIIILLLINISKDSFAQSIEEKAYKEAISTGMSTAPSLVVFTVKNFNTGQSKEICTEVPSLYWAVQQEMAKGSKEDIMKVLLSHTSDRKYEFKTKEALDGVHFSSYHLNHATEIAKIIERNHLTDSLSKTIEFRKQLSDKFYEYKDKRDSLLGFLSDSITTKRPLSAEETKILKDLDDQYYDIYYNKPNNYGFDHLSEQGKGLIKIWNAKVKVDKQSYEKLTNEMTRATNKFFFNYYKKYGISFCHIAFKYGILSNYGDENPVIHLSGIVE